MIALCAGSYSAVPEGAELNSLVEKFMSVNKGLVLSLGVFFIISGISVLLRKKWSLTLIASSSLFRIVLLFVSMGFTIFFLRDPSYIENLKTQSGDVEWVFVYLALAGIFVLEISIPAIFLLMTRLKTVKKFFSVSGTENTKPPS